MKRKSAQVKHRFLRSVWFIWLLWPAAGAMIWSIYPAGEALLAITKFDLPSLSEEDWIDPQRLNELRRSTQKHFLAHEVYIPLEDIITPGSEGPTKGNSSSLSLLMQKACGQGKIYIWVPLKFRLPIVGEKVVEWCWKPQNKNM